MHESTAAMCVDLSARRRHQLVDARNPRDLRSCGCAVHVASEVWDAMWVPVYRNGQQTGARTDVVLSIDLLRRIDVYAVDPPGGAGAAVRQTASGGFRAAAD